MTIIGEHNAHSFLDHPCRCRHRGGAGVVVVVMNVAIDAPKRPALRYYGGKWNLAPWIISFFPPHLNYVEPCGGAASVLLQKPRSPLETFNDLDGNVVNFFRVLRDQPDELIKKLRLTPYAQDEYFLSLQICTDEIERARRFFVMLWMSLQGGSHDSAKGSWRTQTNAIHSDGGTRWAKPPSQFIDVVESIDKVAQRFRYVQICNNNSVKIIANYDNADALIYFDPPYVTNTRAQTERYALEWCDEDHENAAALRRLRRCLRLRLPAVRRPVRSAWLATPRPRSADQQWRQAYRIGMAESAHRRSTGEAKTGGVVRIEKIG